jgi:hypothetical protein
MLAIHATLRLSLPFELHSPVTLPSGKVHPRFEQLVVQEHQMKRVPWFLLSMLAEQSSLAPHELQEHLSDVETSPRMDIARTQHIQRAC